MSRAISLKSNDVGTPVLSLSCDNEIWDLPLDGSDHGLGRLSMPNLDGEMSWQDKEAFMVIGRVVMNALRHYHPANLGFEQQRSKRRA